VVIERLSYEKLIARYDRPGTLFYLDPPYWGCTNDYGLNVFSQADFEHLSDLLNNISGRFILSINETPEVRAIFAGFSVKEVVVNYRLGGNARPARELIISGGMQR
jgi:DNA adenine methylase